MLIRSKENLTYPFEYQIQELSLYSTLIDKRVNLSEVMGEISIYENIFTNVITGNIVVQEAANMISNFPIVGHEKIDITLFDPQKPDIEIKKTFRVYSLSDINAPRQDINTYIINFISEEYLNNIKTSISRSFPNTTISNMVRKIFLSSLDSDKDIDVEKTKNNHDIVIPNWKPIDAINWLSKRSVAEKYEGANFLFYETREGFNFKSLESLVDKKSQETYRRQRTASTDEPARNLVRDDSGQSIESLRISGSFNLLKNIPIGMYASRMVVHDMIKRKTETIDYDYSKSYPKQMHLENNPDNKKWLLEEVQGVDAQGTSMLVGETTDDYTTSPLSKQYQIVRFDGKNDYTERAIQNRISQMQQMENVKISVTLPGDVKRNVGDIITFDLDSIQAGERAEDRLYSGKYLVTSLRHSIKDDRHSMIMEVVKDSYFSSLPKGK